MNSIGIAVDNQSRIYLSNNGSVEIYSDTGEQLSALFFSGDTDAFALDKENNIYILSNDKVLKRQAFKQD